MFNAGRILRNLNRRESLAPGRASFLAAPVVKKEKRKFRCYVPFVWQALTATCLGLIVIFVGVGLCVVGYYADRFRPTSLQSRRLDNDTSAAWVDDEATSRDGGSGAGSGGGGYNHLKTLIYIGPALMSCGSFAIVFSCVVVCEMRDKVLEMMDEREKILGVQQPQQKQQKPNFKIDFFQSVVYPQHNRPRPGQRSNTHNTSSAPADPFPPCAVGASGSSGPLIPMTELRPKENPSPVTASSLSSMRVCPVSCGRIDLSGTPQGGSSCPGEVAAGSDGSTSDGPSRRPTLISGTSVEESEGQGTGSAARKRVRYPSEPLLLLHHGRHGRPSAGIRWSPATQGATAVLLKADGRGWPPERRREGPAGGRLLIARVQTDTAGQRPPQQRVATKRLLVSRKPMVRGGRGTGFHTSSVEVLTGRDEVRLLHDSNKDATLVCLEGMNTAGTQATTGLTHSLPPPPRPTQVRLKAHIADPPPNVLVHQAYVHAEPDRGTPVTSILPPPPSKSLLGTTSLSRMTSPPGMTSLPVMTSSPGMTTTPHQGVTSPPGVTSLPFMTSLPRMTTACPPGKSSIPPLSHRLSLPSGDSDSGFAFGSMQISGNKCSSRLAIRDQKQQKQKKQQQQYQQPLHEHQSQKMRVEASRTSSIKDFC